MAGKFDVFLGKWRQKDAGNDNYKGNFPTLAALQSAHTTASDGDYAIVSGSVDALFIWDSDTTSWIKNASRNGSYPEVSNFGALPTAADNSGMIYITLASEGNWITNRKPAGLYLSNGTAWNKLNNFVEAFNDANMRIYNNLDDTKGVKFEVSNITTGNVRTLVTPDKDGEIALLDDVDAMQIKLENTNINFSEYIIPPAINQHASQYGINSIAINDNASIKVVGNSDAPRANGHRTGVVHCWINGNYHLIEPIRTDSSQDFGWTVDCDGDDIVIGAPYVNVLTSSSAGEVYRYNCSTGVPVLKNTLNILDFGLTQSYNDKLGTRVRIKNNKIVASSPEYDWDATDKVGAVFGWEIDGDNCNINSNFPLGKDATQTMDSDSISDLDFNGTDIIFGDIGSDEQVTNGGDITIIKNSFDTPSWFYIETSVPFAISGKAVAINETSEYISYSTGASVLRLTPDEHTSYSDVSNIIHIAKWNGTGYVEVWHKNYALIDKALEYNEQISMSGNYVCISWDEMGYSSSHKGGSFCLLENIGNDEYRENTRLCPYDELKELEVYGGNDTDFGETIYLKNNKIFTSTHRMNTLDLSSAGTTMLFDVEKVNITGISQNITKSKNELATSYGVQIGLSRLHSLVRTIYGSIIVDGLYSKLTTRGVTFGTTVWENIRLGIDGIFAKSNNTVTNRNIDISSGTYSTKPIQLLNTGDTNRVCKIWNAIDVENVELEIGKIDNGVGTVSITDEDDNIICKLFSKGFVKIYSDGINWLVLDKHANPVIDAYTEFDYKAQNIFGDGFSNDAIRIVGKGTHKSKGQLLFGDNDRSYIEEIRDDIFRTHGSLGVINSVGAYSDINELQFFKYLTDEGFDYKFKVIQGYISINNGDTAILGDSTQFTDDLSVGQTICFADAEAIFTFKISSIINDTHCIIDSPYIGQDANDIALFKSTIIQDFDTGDTLINGLYIVKSQNIKTDTLITKQSTNVDTTVEELTATLSSTPLDWQRHDITNTGYPGNLLEVEGDGHQIIGPSQRGKTKIISQDQSLNIEFDGDISPSVLTITPMLIDDTSVEIADSAGFKKGRWCNVNGDNMLITDIVGNTLTVIRNVNGIEATSHGIDATIQMQGTWRIK